MSSSIPKLRLPRAIAFTVGAVALVLAACEATTPMNVETPAPQQAEPDAVAAVVETPVEVLPMKTAGEPLVIVDGVIMEGRVAELDPKTIDTIEVIKGEAAARLYGPRGRDGVISIVTKKDGIEVVESGARATLREKEVEEVLLRRDAGKEAVGRVVVRQTVPKDVIVQVRPKAAVEETVAGKLVARKLADVRITGAEVEKVLEARKADIVKLREQPLTKIQGPQPLFMIDGVIVDSIELDRLRMQDIERIEVVKGAAAAALYGPEGANGVINITTKR
jgi:TonB-dependent SusC/RagA subfamily outer membrane receptor